MAPQLLDIHYMIAATRNKESGAERETGYIQQFSLALVGLQGYLCVRDLSREDDIYLSMTNTYNWQGQARQNVIMLYLGDLSYNFIL